MKLYNVLDVQIDAIERNETCAWVDLPQGKDGIGVKWINKRKHKAFVFLVVIAHFNWKYFKLNVKSTFLNGVLVEKVFAVGL